MFNSCSLLVRSFSADAGADNDPINFVDPSGKSAAAVIRALAYGCIAYEVYDAVQTAIDMNNMANEINETQKQIDRLVQQQSSSDCPEDFEEEIAHLNKKFIGLQEQRAKSGAKTGLINLGITAMCAGFAKLAGK